MFRYQNIVLEDLTDGTRQLVPTENPRTEGEARLNQLWGRFRVVAKAVGSFGGLNTRIKKFGAAQNISQRRTASGGDSKHPLCLIYPRSCCFQVWSVVVFFLLLWTILVMPFRLCFIETPTEGMFYAELGVDVLFIVDIILTFNTAFYDKLETLVTSRKAIAKQYLKTWFVIDMLGCLPVQYLQASESDPSYNKIGRLLRLPRLYKLLRALRLFKLVRLVRSKEAAQRFLSKLKANYAAIQLLASMLAVLATVHVLACLWYFLAVLDYEYSTWTVVHMMAEAPLMERYLVSLYWVFTTLTSVGYGDISPQTNHERVFAVFVMSLGFTFYSYVIGTMSYLVLNMDQEKNTRDSRISAFNELARAINLPADLLEKVKLNFESLYEWSHYNRFNQSSFTTNLPVRLRTQVSQFLHKEFIKNILLFRNRREVLLLYAVPKLKLCQLVRQDVVYLIDDLADEVYFVHLGSVTFRAANGIAYRHYSTGSYFGDIEVLRGQPRLDNVQVTVPLTILYVLSGNHFVELANEFPDVGEEIWNVAKKRERILRKGRRHVMKLNCEPEHCSYSQDEPQLSQPVIAYHKQDTEEVVQDRYRTERGQRYKYLWKNIQSGSLQSMQHSLMTKQLMTNRCNFQLGAECYLRSVTPKYRGKTRLMAEPRAYIAVPETLHLERLDEFILNRLEAQRDSFSTDFGKESLFRSGQSILHKLEAVLSNTR